MRGWDGAGRVLKGEEDLTLLYIGMLYRVFIAGTDRNRQSIYKPIESIYISCDRKMHKHIENIQTKTYERYCRMTETSGLCQCIIRPIDNIYSKSH